MHVVGLQGFRTYGLGFEVGMLEHQLASTTYQHQLTTEPRNLSCEGTTQTFQTPSIEEL